MLWLKPDLLILIFSGSFSSPGTVQVLGWDSPLLKLYYLSLWLAIFQWKSQLEEKTVIVELGESQPRWLRISVLWHNIFCFYLPLIFKLSKIHSSYLQLPKEQAPAWHFSCHCFFVIFGPPKELYSTYVFLHRVLNLGLLVT